MECQSKTRVDAPTEHTTDPRPRYEPPRVTKKRSVQRVTGTFSGATAQGSTVQGIATVPP